MKFKLLVLFAVSLFALEAFGNGNNPKHRFRAPDVCSVSSKDNPMTIELGDSSNIEVFLTDQSNSSAAASFTTVWSPAPTVTDSASSNTYAHPATTTTYTVTVSDSACGTLTDTVTVHIGCTLTATVATTSFYCSANAGTAIVTPSSGVAPYSYSWMPGGQTTDTITGINPGTYSVTVTDSNGCSATDTFSIVKSALVITASATPTMIEKGDSTDLSVTLTDSASNSSYSESYTVLWSPSASVTDSTLSTSYAHPTVTTTYTVSVTTPCGTVTDTVTVFIECTVKDSVITTPYFCSADAGSAIADVSNGLAPYTYSWSPGGQTTDTVNGLTPGTYAVMVKDSNGCSVTDTVKISHDSFIVTPSATPNTVEAGDSADLNVTVMDSLTGSTSSSSLSYTVAWTPASSLTTPDTSSTYAHPKVTTTYTVTITTACGTITDTVTVFIGCTVKDSVTTTPYYCPTDAGTATATGTGGVAPYTYLWSPGGKTTDTLDGLKNGTYILTIKDSNGCSQTDTVKVPHDSYTLITNASSNNIVAGDSTDLSVTVTDSLLGSTSSSSLSYTVMWMPSSSVTYDDSASTYAHPAVTTTYTVIVTTQCGTVTDSITITVTPAGIATLAAPGNSVVISPNPGSGLFTMSYNLVKDEDITLNIVDELGRTVYNNQLVHQPAGISRQTLDIENLAEGIYSLRMITQEGIMVSKIVIMKNR